MNVLVFGANGFLGQRFAALYPDAATPPVDIADREAVIGALETHQPDIVINCAGKTGRPNVDWCEDHKQETLHSNVTGPLVLLEECLKRSIYFVHLSSGCIYEGDNGGRGFSESDPPNFFGSFYSRTKLWSDQILKDFPVLQLRIRMPFDGSTDPRSLLTKLRGYTKILDVDNSLSCIPDVLSAAAALIAKRATGTYNIVNPGAMSPYRAMERYRELVDAHHAFERLDLADLPSVTKAARSNCILSGAKLAEAGVHMRSVEEALDSCLLELKDLIQ